MAYDVTLDGSTFRTMMGIDPERAAEFMQEHGADIAALNCGTGMDMERARASRGALPQRPWLPVMAQPNAGQPRLVDMKVVYDETPAQMVSGVAPLLEAGAAIVGACCGSTPEHIRAFRDAMDELEPANMKHKLCDIDPAARAEAAAIHGRQVRHRRALRGCVPETDERQARRRHAGEMQAPRLEDRAYRRARRKAKA